ncbi:MAG: hypothetical protein KDJ49_09950 [Alphaproteobacteria bacterium]|nr:hypothetical protein [Alphaproteobacteria bacterium]
MEKTTNTPKQPSHIIWQVIGEQDRARWIRVGAAWANRDGKGLTLKFDAYPVAGRTVIREITARIGSAAIV